MLNQNEQDTVIEKARELCQTIVSQPGMMSARRQVEAFLADEHARTHYQGLVSKGQGLQQKQQLSQALSDDEIADFESHREAVLNNPISKGFLDAQETMRELHHSITKMISMTLESGTVPTQEDMQAASCGQGCNCEH